MNSHVFWYYYTLFQLLENHGEDSIILFKHAMFEFVDGVYYNEPNEEEAA